LQAKFRLLWAGALVGATWAAWHLPLVWLEGAAQKGSSFLLFALMVLPLAVMFSWVFNRSNGGLLLPLVFHTSINVVSYLVVPEVLGALTGSAAMTACFLVVLWIAAASLVFFAGEKYPLRIWQTYGPPERGAREGSSQQFG
jgi:hypothetical protein